MSATPVTVGIIGLGFMGRTHLDAYLRAAGEGLCRVIAVADQHVAARLADRAPKGNIAAADAPPPLPTDLKSFADPAALLAEPRIDLVSICTPTDTHVGLTLAALGAGKHVVVEKPVAVDPGDVYKVLCAEHSAKRVVMPAMVMRFWPGWAWLREQVRAKTYGRLTGLTLRRLGSMPGWSPEFYRDQARTGGALVDLHIHDADFVLWTLGFPSSVTTVGTLNHAVTTYRFEGELADAHVVAEGGWGQAPGSPFRMEYTAYFERATATFDLSRSPAVVVYRDGASETPALPTLGGYDLEIRHAIEAVAAFKAGRSEALRATVMDAMNVAALLQYERQSLETRGPVRVELLRSAPIFMDLKRTN